MLIREIVSALDRAVNTPTPTSSSTSSALHNSQNPPIVSKKQKLFSENAGTRDTTSSEIDRSEIEKGEVLPVPSRLEQTPALPPTYRVALRKSTRLALNAGGEVQPDSTSIYGGGSTIGTGLAWSSQLSSTQPLLTTGRQTSGATVSEYNTGGESGVAEVKGAACDQET